jgi:hypothetical protein
VLNITCPRDNCNTLLAEDFILEELPHNLREKFSKFKKITLMSNDPLLKWCPKEGCDNFARAENSQVKKVICPCGQ